MNSYIVVILHYDNTVFKSTGWSNSGLTMRLGVGTLQQQPFFQKMCSLLTLYCIRLHNMLSWALSMLNVLSCNVESVFRVTTVTFTQLSYCRACMWLHLLSGFHSCSTLQPCTPYLSSSLPPGMTCLCTTLFPSIPPSSPPFHS